jgi:hypothetical protein
MFNAVMLHANRRRLREWLALRAVFFRAHHRLSWCTRPVQRAGRSPSSRTGHRTMRDSFAHRETKSSSPVKYQNMTRASLIAFVTIVVMLLGCWPAPAARGEPTSPAAQDILTTRENAPNTLVGTWDVVRLLVDEQDRMHWGYQPDDPAARRPYPSSSTDHNSVQRPRVQLR